MGICILVVANKISSKAEWSPLFYHQRTTMAVVATEQQQKKLHTWSGTKSGSGHSRLSRPEHISGSYRKKQRGEHLGIGQCSMRMDTQRPCRTRANIKYRFHLRYLGGGSPSTDFKVGSAYMDPVLKISAAS